MPLPNVHGGDRRAAATIAGCQPHEILDFSANINPFGAPPGALDAARDAISHAAHYPDPLADPLRTRLADHLGCDVLVGNGATELIYAALVGARRVWWRTPAYLGYAEATRAVGARRVDHPAQADAILIGRPNNPDGDLPDALSIIAQARRQPRTRFLIDESFLAFTDARDGSCLRYPRPDNLWVVTSMTKTYAIPGLRLGWIAGALGDLSCRIPPWTVNGPALAAGLVCLSADAWLTRCADAIADWRRQLHTALVALPGVVSVQGTANYLLLRLDTPIAATLRERMLREHRVLIRNAQNFEGLDARYVRVAVRTPQENAHLLSSFTSSWR